MVCTCGNPLPRHDSTYCSRECYQASRAAKVVTMTCKHCGEPFTVKGYRATRRKGYCSTSCRARGVATETRPSRKSWQETRYGLTSEDIDRLLQRQAGVCAICQVPHDALCIDHDHTTGEVRGLLCKTCNSGIGFLGDSITNVKRALLYLKQPPAQS